MATKTKAATKKKAPAKKATPKRKRITPAPKSDKLAFANEDINDTPYDEDRVEFERTIYEIEKLCSTIGWNLAAGVDDKAGAIVGIIAGDEEYMEAMLGGATPR